MFVRSWPKQRAPQAEHNEKVLPGDSCACVGKALCRLGNNRARGISADVGRPAIVFVPRGESGVAFSGGPGVALDLAPSRAASVIVGAGALAG